MQLKCFELVPLVANVPPLVGVKEVVAAAAVELITRIPTAPSIIGAVPPVLFIRCILKIQF